MPITEADYQAMRAVVETQLQAFQQENWPQAYALAAPAIRAQVGSLAQFKRMVQVSYHPVYRPRSVIFEGWTEVQGQPALPLLLMSAHRHLFRAYYIMERQPDQHWRVLGCHLVRLQDSNPQPREGA